MKDKFCLPNHTFVITEALKIWSVNVDNTSGIVCTMDYRGEGELSVDSNRLVLISLVY